MTTVSGVISGLVDQTITAVTPNPNFSSPAYSPDGSFIYNNVYYPTGMAFDANGLLVRHRAESGRLLEPLGHLARQLFAL